MRSSTNSFTASVDPVSTTVNNPASVGAVSSQHGPAELKDVVKRARERQGLTQVEFADAVDMSQRWVSDLERGLIKAPRLDTMLRVAKVLDLDVADLVIASGQATTRAGAERILNSVDGDATATDRSQPTPRIDAPPRTVESRINAAIRALKKIDLTHGERLEVLESIVRTWQEADSQRQANEDGS